MAGRLVDYVGSGLAAALPAAATIDAVLTTGAAGFYYATDTQTLYCLDRSGTPSWDALTAGAYTDEMAQDAVGGILIDSSTVDFTYDDGAGTITASVIASAVKPTESFIIACSDESTALTTGTAKATFRVPYAFTLSAVRASVTTAPTGAALVVDINENGTTILSTKLTIDVSEKTSTTAATPAVISDTALADDAEITVDIDTVGSTIAGAGLKVTLIGART